MFVEPVAKRPYLFRWFQIVCNSFVRHFVGYLEGLYYDGWKECFALGHRPLAYPIHCYIVQCKREQHKTSFWQLPTAIPVDFNFLVFIHKIKSDVIDDVDRFIEEIEGSHKNRKVGIEPRRFGWIINVLHHIEFRNRELNPTIRCDFDARSYPY